MEHNVSMMIKNSAKYAGRMDQRSLLEKEDTSGGVGFGCHTSLDRVVVITQDQQHGYRMEMQPYDIHEMVTVKALSLRCVLCPLYESVIERFLRLKYIHAGMHSSFIHQRRHHSRVSLAYVQILYF